jgi:hypothetical protein
MRLDEEKLEALRSWGERLGESSSEEHAAIGRAILMLVAEIDRLHIDLWHARMVPGEKEPVVLAGREPAQAGHGSVVNVQPEAEKTAVTTGLQSRLERVLRRNRPDEPVEHSRSDVEVESTTSPQAWIAELRRQK